MATQIMQSYTPYGHTSAHSTTPLILFNGEALICPLYVYSLGMGIRSYSPALMRFFQPTGLVRSAKEVSTLITIARETPSTSKTPAAKLDNYHAKCVEKW